MKRYLTIHGKKVEIIRIKDYIKTKNYERNEDKVQGMQERKERKELR